MSYTLVIVIDREDVIKLSDQGYSLCLAKKADDNSKTGNGYTVIWSGSEEFSVKNTFQWQEDYMVFGVKYYKVGSLVESATDDQSIKSKQTCIMKSKVMDPATGSQGKTGPFFVKNEWQDRCIGIKNRLNHLITNPDSTVLASGQDTVPLFVTPYEALLNSTTSLEPIEQVSVWFERGAKSRMMISETRSNAFEIDFNKEGKTELTAKYKKGEWSIDRSKSE